METASSAEKKKNTEREIVLSSLSYSNSESAGGVKKG